jgi:two-component system NarL family sensor kinase
MIGKLAGCIFFLLLAISGLSQQHLVDSITKELEMPMPDSNRAVSMMRLAIDYEGIDTSKAYEAYRHAIAFAGEKKLHYYLGRIYHNQSFLFSSGANYLRSKSSLDTAIANYQKSTHPRAKQWEGNAYGDMANALRLLNETDQSVIYQLKCIALFEQLDLQQEIVMRYCNLSSLFGDMREYEKEEEYAKKAVSSAYKAGTASRLLYAYMTLANASTHSDKISVAKTALDSARSYFDEKSNIDILVTYFLISAQVYRKMNELDSAFYYFQRCFDVSMEYNYGFGKAESQIEMGAISIMQKRYPRAEEYLLKGVREAEAMRLFNLLDDGYKYLSDVYAGTGRYKLAYEYFQKYKEKNDSVVDMDSKKYATNLEKKYQTEKKDNELRLQKLQLQRKNVQNYILMGSVLGLLIISVLTYRNYRQKRILQQQRISELEKAKQLTATEAVLKGEEQERTRLAKDLHDGLGGMLSGIKYSFQTMKGNLIMTHENQLAFERSMDMLDSSIIEMRRVAHNMMPEALVKFGLDAAISDFCNDINQSGALQVNCQSIGLKDAVIEQTTAITIYRIVQELINNIIKHASAKSAIVQVSKIDDKVTITVEDDGKGFNPAILTRKKGIGWSNILSRIEYLKGKSDIQSEPDKGTSIHIELTL